MTGQKLGAWSRTVLLAGVSLLFAVAASAQEQAEPKQSLIGAPLPEPNGFDILLQVATPFNGGPEGTPGPENVLLADEIARRDRAAVPRNARALKLMREALELPIQHTPVNDFATDFEHYGGFRALAVLVKREGALRASKRDWVGAMNSNLDCIKLGVVLTRGGPIRACQAGQAIENLGRRDLEPIISQLNAPECLAAAKRLAEIESLRPLFSDSIRQEKITAAALTRQAFEQLDWAEVVMQTVKPNGENFSEDEIGVLSVIGQNEVQLNIARVLDNAMTAAETPYRPSQARIERAGDPWSRLVTEPVTYPSFRADYEAARTQNWLLKLALELRAAKLEVGKYPATLNTPADPFAGSPNEEIELQYRLQNDAYLLYSVGPDGKDDGGTALKFSEGGLVAPNASGDLLAPVFSK